jgi:hypothetical protein
MLEANAPVQCWENSSIGLEITLAMLFLNYPYYTVPLLLQRSPFLMLTTKQLLDGQSHLKESLIHGVNFLGNAIVTGCISLRI